METTLYWLPHCDTCKKVAAFLQQNDVVVTRFHNLKLEMLNSEQILQLAKMVGGIENLFSRRAIKYRELGLNKREVSADEMLEFMISDYTFIKRPVLVINDSAISGFSEKNYQGFISK
jgi:arsenate reductase (glutaredoxin)